jgi:hypothetical protein
MASLDNRNGQKSGIGDEISSKPNVLRIRSFTVLNISIGAHPHVKGKWWWEVSWNQAKYDWGEADSLGLAIGETIVAVFKMTEDGTMGNQ